MLLTLFSLTMGYDSWSSSATYSTGSIVTHIGKTWKAVRYVYQNTPPTGSGNWFWELFVDTQIDPVQSDPVEWSSTITYDSGSTVRYDGRLWSAKSYVPLNAPPSGDRGGNYWGEFSLSPDIKTEYFHDTYKVQHGNPDMGMIFEINGRFDNTNHTFGVVTDINNPNCTKTHDTPIDDLLDGSLTIPAEADIVQVYVSWRELEPIDDNFSVLKRLSDVIDICNDQGKQVALRLDCSDGDAGRRGWLPKWLVGDPNNSTDFGKLGKANVSIYSYDGNDCHQPDYGNQIFLDELEEFLNTLSSYRTNGVGKTIDQRITYVDLRVVGRFGEWGGWKNADNFDWGTRDYQRESLEKIINIYDNAFNEAQVLLPVAGQTLDNISLIDPFNGGEPSNEDREKNWAYDYGLNEKRKHHFGLRSDTNYDNQDPYWYHWNKTVGSVTFNTEEFKRWMIKNNWRDHIATYEGTCWFKTDPTDATHRYNSEFRRSYYITSALGYHTNYGTYNDARIDPLHQLSDHSWEEMLNVQGDLFPEFARNVGYRFLLNEIKYDSKIKNSGILFISQKWTNRAYGLAHKNYSLKFELADQNGKIAWSGIESNFPTEVWEKGNIYTVNSALSLDVPNTLQSGQYDLLLSVINDEGNTIIELPMDEYSDKRYKVGSIEVGSKYVSDFVSGHSQFIKVECEDYSGREGAVRVEPSSILDYTTFKPRRVGWFSNDESIEFDFVEIPEDGKYQLTVMAGVITSGKTFEVSVDGGEPVTLTVPTGSAFHEVKPVSTMLSLEKGTRVIKITTPTGSIDFDYFTLRKLGSDEFYIVPEEAELHGVQLVTPTPLDNNCSKVIGYCHSGDWFEKGVSVTEPGYYLVQVRYAKTMSNQTFDITVDGISLSSNNNPDVTGSHSSFKTYNTEVYLPKGQHQLAIKMVNANGGISFNWVKLTKRVEYSTTIEAEEYSRSVLASKHPATLRPTIDSYMSLDGKENQVYYSYVDEATNTSIFRDTDIDNKLLFHSIYIPADDYYTLEYKYSNTEAMTFSITIDEDVTEISKTNVAGHAEHWVVGSLDPKFLTKGLHTVVFEAKTKDASLNLDNFTLRSNYKNEKREGIVKKAFFLPAITKKD